MTNLRNLILIVLAALAAISLSSCGGGMGGGGGDDNDQQLLQLDKFDANPGERILNLAGPDGGGSVAVTYYVFGSHVNLGNEVDVPLFPDRMEEANVGTLAFGETLEDVDLSPWDAYEFVYLRAIPCEPQIIVLLEDGNRYDFSSS